MANHRLNTLENINSALAAFRNNPDVRPELFYSRILEDTIKVPMEDYVHVQHATESRTLPQGHQKLNLRRLGSWTPHTSVLPEGIPPRPDVTKSESIELGYTQFGRFAYFTDQIRTDVLDDFVAHYTKELSDLANRTIEKFAREKLLSAPSAYIANAKQSVGELLPGDTITIADLRLMVKKFDRNLIKPINGNFNYICSPEFMHDLIDDPYVENYMRINQSTFNMYTNEEPFPLFKVKFFVTRLDENLAPDIDHPGEYLNSTGNYEIRLVNADRDKIFSVVADNQEIVDLEDEVDGNNKLATRAILKKYYYKDGSAIENRVAWVFKDFAITNQNVKNVALKVGDVWVPGVHTDVTFADIKTASELPINRGILTGAEGLVKVQVEGQGATQIIVKELGSAGTADPLNQLSSIGFKIQGLGFGFLRPEAVYITYSLPYTSVAMLGLTTNAVLGNENNHIGPKGNIVRILDGTEYKDYYVDKEGNLTDEVGNPVNLGLQTGFGDEAEADDRKKMPPHFPTNWVVQFNVDGGSHVNAVVVADGALVAKPVDPTKDSKTFDGWYKEVGHENAWDFEVDTVKANTVLYAKWDE